MKSLVGLVCGFVFAVGLALSGMAQPSKVLGFLDVAGGAWDPSLAFVMLGGIAVVALGRRLAPTKPLFDRAYPVLRRHGIDRRLILGAASSASAGGSSAIAPVRPSYLSAPACRERSFFARPCSWAWPFSKFPICNNFIRRHFLLGAPRHAG